MRTWGIIGILVLLSALLVGFLTMQPSPDDLLLETYGSLKTISDAHAVVEFNLDTPEEQHQGKLEVWGRMGEDETGAFRVEVLESSKEEFVGAVMVSDGETIWAFDPNVNNVLTGTLEEAKQLAEQSTYFADKHDEFGDFDHGDFDYPESPDEALGLLKEYFDIENKGSETIGNSSAYRLEFVPIGEKMPPEFIGVGGLFNLWIDTSLSVPLGFEYTGGTLGEALVTITSLELNIGLDDSLFTFQIPADAEVMGIEDILPQSITMEELPELTEGQILTPSELPEGATLVDILEVQGAIVLRYTWSEGGSFTVAQGVSSEAMDFPTDAESVDVRGVTGNLFVDEGGNRVLLAWEENGVLYAIAGDLTPEQAQMLAESLQ
jgi:outer membrane lipoprotein-sorting protein